VPVFVAQHDNVRVVIGVEHQSLEMHLGNHGKQLSPNPPEIIETRKEFCTLSFLNLACQRSWRDPRGKSVIRVTETTSRAAA
jgi:hypothetical protein